MNVKNKAKMFSSSNSNTELQENFIKSKNSAKNSPTPKSNKASNNYSNKKNNNSSSPKSGTKSSFQFFTKTSNFLKDIWYDKKKRYIVIGIISFILLLIIIIAISSSSSSSNKAYSGAIYEKPNCKGICDNPYDIEVFTEDKLKYELKKCGYKENTELFNYAMSAILRHNLLRACHDAQPLMFNCEIMEISQDYSEYLAKTGKFEHSGHSFHDEWMGENLAYTGGMSVTGELPTNMWYNEISAYDFNNPGFSSGTGHFTQVIWRSSNEFGIGLACKNSECYMTANYFPGGNILGLFEEEVKNFR